MYCLLGLGNPGEQYARSRHNLGYRVVEELARRHQIRLRGRFYARMGQGRIAGQPVTLAQPLTFMNNSGYAAQRLLQRYRLAPRDLLVLYDDLDLPLGALRLRPNGSSGTHNGMRSVVEHLGTEAFPRLRLGIGPLPPRTDAARFVLSPFTPAELPAIEAALLRAVEVVEYLLANDLEAAMNEHNRTAPPTGA